MNMPFTRPGAIDLSGLKRGAPGPRGTTPAPAGGAGASTGSGAAYSVEVDEQNFFHATETGKRVSETDGFGARHNTPAAGRDRGRPAREVRCRPRDRAPSRAAGGGALSCSACRAAPELTRRVRVSRFV